MAELRINAPDALADDVRRLDVAVDAVCRGALLEWVLARVEVVARALQSDHVDPVRLRLATVSLLAAFALARSSGGLASAVAE